VRSPASCSGASVGSSFARLGVKASRSRANVSGLLGKRTRKSYVRRAKTRGPWWSARQIATGWRCERVRSVVTHASIASGVCASCKHSRLAVPAAWRQIAWLASAQSSPTKAAQGLCDVGVRRHLLGCVSVARKNRHADVLRKHEREPVARQTLRVR
jgi:hypothetical protein